MQVVTQVGLILCCAKTMTDDIGNKTLGNLILGGYDRRRFIPNNYTFAFLDVPDMNAILALEMIDMKLEGAIVPLLGSSMGDNITLLSKDPQTKSLFSLKTSPYLDLPQASCDAIALAFNLTYNPQTSRYLISKDVHKQLIHSGAALTLSLIDYRRPSDKPLNIRLDYTALHYFDGGPNGTGERYMPIRPKPDNSYVDEAFKAVGLAATLYSLGRPFFQEAYVIADYESSKFYVHQVDWKSPSNDTDVVALTDSPRFDVDVKSQKLSANSKKTTAITASVVSIIACLLIFVIILLWRRRRRRKKNDLALLQAGKLATMPSQDTNATPNSKVVELNDVSRDCPEELTTESELTELSSSGRAEMLGRSIPHTLDSRPVFEMDGTRAEESKVTCSQVISSSNTQTSLQGATLASPIPKTPAEYYGNNEGAWKQRDINQKRNLQEQQRGTKMNRQSI